MTSPATDAKPVTPASTGPDWSKLQGRLKMLYTGPDPMFLQSTLCANCNLTAVEAGDCTKCHKLICGPCQGLATNRQCKNCREPVKNVDKLHPVEQAMFDRATFNCCYEACKLKAIPYNDYANHVFKECKFRVIECPNGCGCPPFEVSQEVVHRRTCSKEQVTCAACKKVKVARKDLKSHLEKDCTNSNLICTKCEGSYKASEEHCCITHLRGLIHGLAGSASEDRDQISDTLENFNSHIQKSLKLLDQKCLDQQNMTTTLLQGLVGLNTQIAMIQTTKLDEITKTIQKQQEVSSARALPEGPSFNLKITQPIGPKVECRRIPIQGSQTGKYFEYPEVQKIVTEKAEELFCSAEFKTRLLTKISACVGVGIYSLKLYFDDGTTSPLIGSRPEVSCELVLGGNDQVSQVGIRAWKDNYVQTVTIARAGQKGVLSLESQSNNGTIQEFKLDKGERIVGVHGYLDPNGDLRGFGFIVLKPWI